MYTMTIMTIQIINNYRDDSRRDDSHTDDSHTDDSHIYL